MPEYLWYIQVNRGTCWETIQPIGTRREARRLLKHYRKHDSVYRYRIAPREEMNDLHAQRCGCADPGGPECSRWYPEDPDWCDEHGWEMKPCAPLSEHPEGERGE